MVNHHPFSPSPRGVFHTGTRVLRIFLGIHQKTYIQPSNASKGEYVRPSNQGWPNQQKWKVVNIGVGSSYHDNSHMTKKYSYGPHNYLGKNPWRGHNGVDTRESKKVAYEVVGSKCNNKTPKKRTSEVAKRPVK